MWLKGLIIVAAVCSLAGCSKSQEAEQLASNPYDDIGKQMAWNDAGKEAIKTRLKDPDSAKFKDVEFHMAMGNPITCGQVNSKNGFGGYGGYERFIAAGNVITVLESEMASGEMDKTWQQFCRP